MKKNLATGEVLAFKTDTVWGFGCNLKVMFCFHQLSKLNYSIMSIPRVMVLTHKTWVISIY